MSGFVWNLALQMAAPFFNVYLVRHLGAPAPPTVGFLAAVNTLFGLIGGGISAGSWPGWVGCRSPGAHGFPRLPIVPTAWILGDWSSGRSACSKPTPGSSGQGYNLANFALLLELTPRPTAFRPSRSTRRWCSRAPWWGRYSEAGSPTRSGSSYFAASSVGRLVGILLYVWLAVWPVLRCGRRPTASEAGAA